MTGSIRHPPGAVVTEAAGLFHLLGGMSASHLTIVGGMVPPLLVPAATRPHVGSADLDLCLSVAITDGATRQYYRSIQATIEQYFEPASHSGHRWRKRAGAPGIPLVVDFLAPHGQATTTVADGSERFHSTVAQANAGQRLSPFGIRAGALIDRDAETRTIEGAELVYRTGASADVSIRFAGPVGMLAAKADALTGRDEPKDGYDVAWWCLNAADSAERVAQLVTTRAAFSDPLFAETVAQLRSAFRAPTYPGPDGYARIAAPAFDPDEPAFAQAHNEAFLRTSQVIELLARALW